MKKNFIVTYYDDSFSEIRDIVLDRFQAYAHKCKADLLVIENWNEDKTKHFLLNRLMSMNNIAKNGRYLFIDMDTLVRKDTPDLFKLVPKNHLGMLNEGGNWFRSNMTSINDYQVKDEVLFNNCAKIALNEYISCNVQLNLDAPISYEIQVGFNLPFNHYNMGVMLCDDKLMKTLNLDSILIDKNQEVLKKFWVIDQLLVNLLIRKLKIPVYELPCCFNCFFGYRTSDYLKRNFINHYCGLENNLRFDFMKKDDVLLKNFGF